VTGRAYPRRNSRALRLDLESYWFIVVGSWTNKRSRSYLPDERGARNPDSVSFLNMYPGLFLSRSAQVYPNKSAIIYGDRSYSYSEFDERISKLAGAFVKAGINPGDRVAYLVPNIPEMLEGHYGPMRMGAVLVAINIRLSSREIGYIIKHSGARALVFDSEYADVVDQALGESSAVDLLVEVVDTTIGAKASGLRGAIEYDQFLQSGEHTELPDLARSELDIVAIDYTSGTTGTPKGVEYTGRGTYLAALGQCVDIGLNSSCTYLWTLPMFHCNGWCYTWAITAAGGTHVCLRAVNADDVFELSSNHEVTHMCAAPTVLTMLEASALNPERASQSTDPLTPSQPERENSRTRSALDGVKIITGGAPPAPKMLRTMKSMGAELVHAYGLTETYGPSTFSADQPGWSDLGIEDHAQMLSRQGVANTVGHTGVRIVDAQMNDVPADAETIGEVVTRGNTIMAGYHRDPEASAEAFAGGWFHTGDLAVMHADGYIELKDRKKDVIISGGENISSVEVEKVLMEHPAVLETCVVGIPSEQWGESPKAFISLREGQTVEASEIIEFCRDRMAHFKAPREVEFGELPKTATGKIQKFLLREREWTGHDRRIG
jgi:fatty-acyl-CoA synthase